MKEKDPIVKEINAVFVETTFEHEYKAWLKIIESVDIKECKRVVRSLLKYDRLINSYLYLEDNWWPSDAIMTWSNTFAEVERDYYGGELL